MYLLFDIGGTKTRLAFSRDAKTFEDPVIINTPQNFKEGISVFKDAVEQLTKGEKIIKAAGAVSGPLDKEHSMVINAPYLEGWNNKPLKKELEKMLSAPVVLENDAALVGLGEAVHGAGKGYDIVAYITVSTGVGGARIVGGKIDASSMGFEPGHQFIDAGGSLCPDCKDPKDLDSYVSGSGVKARYGKEAYEIDDAAVFEKLAELLAYGLNNTIVHWSPDVVVLGGPMITGDPAIPIESIQKHVSEILHIFPNPPPIVKAKLDDVGGLYGALALVQ
ncbi:MAG TPA: ROK family protein [candidate division CPR3 bacterium]|uniref:ROK family protein n=1 Tax=candidate division CPR3 bacterium TaxID=2268181 RepID=A0A7C1S9E4_UNCC3|nr:ROK family protein [candidate division CPR3 bacterium]